MVLATARNPFSKVVCDHTETGEFMEEKTAYCLLDFVRYLLDTSHVGLQYAVSDSDCFL